MIITVQDWGNLAYEAQLYNKENGTTLEAYEYVKQEYHARCENGRYSLELIFEDPKWETYYLMKHL